MLTVYNKIRIYFRISNNLLSGINNVISIKVPYASNLPLGSMTTNMP